MNSVINNTENLSRREREKAQHRQEILNAAIQVFAEKGFHSATLDEIAQKAEFSKAALYLYFSNKEDLLFNIIDETFGKLFEYGREIFSRNVSFKDSLHELFDRIAEGIFNNPDPFVLFAVQHAALFAAVTEEKRNEFVKKHNDVLESIEKRVALAIEQGELRDIKPYAITGMIHGSMDAMINNKWYCSTLEELKNAIPLFIDILFNGIANEKETLT